MPLRIILTLAFVMTLPALAMADAGGGQFMGYQLGSDYQRTVNTQVQATANGNLSVMAEKPIKPVNVAGMGLLILGMFLMGK